MDAARSKVRHCYGDKKPSPFILGRVQEHLQRWYDVANPRQAREFSWIDLDYSKCPLPPLVRDTMAIIAPYSSEPQVEGEGTQLQLAQDKDEFLLDCWETPTPDSLGRVFQLLGECFAPKALNVPTGRYRGRIYTKPE